MGPTAHAPQEDSRRPSERGPAPSASTEAGGEPLSTGVLLTINYAGSNWPANRSTCAVKQ